MFDSTCIAMRRYESQGLLFPHTITFLALYRLDQEVKGLMDVKLHIVVDITVLHVCSVVNSVYF